MRKRRTFSAVVFLAVFLARSVAGVAETTTLENINKLYEEGQYKDAVEGYQNLLGAGVVHERLYYNLGNGLYRLGELGPAIWNYERALQVDPSMADAKYNLQVARAAVGDSVADRLEDAEENSFWVEASRKIAPRWVFLSFLLLTYLVFGLLLLVRFMASGFLRSALVVVNGFLAVALFIFFVFVLGFFYQATYVEEGIILPDRTPMREAPKLESTARVELHPGLRVRVISSRGNWTRIRLGNGVEGWIAASSLGAL